MKLVTRQELDTILAALRWYQDCGMGEPAKRPDWLQDIACPDENDTSLDSAGIDDLCEKLNTGDRVEILDIREEMADDPVLGKDGLLDQLESPPPNCPMCNGQTEWAGGTSLRINCFHCGLTNYPIISNKES